MSQPKESDPLLDEVDEARRRLLAEFGGDWDKVVDYYIALQEQYADRVVDYSKSRRPDQSAA